MTSAEIRDAVCEILKDGKAEDITVLSVGHLTIVADYFVVATASSVTRARTLYEKLDEKMAGERGVPVVRADGAKEGRWIVVDFGGVIVHIFNDELRMMYCLEKLWADGDNVERYR